MANGFDSLSCLVKPSAEVDLASEQAGIVEDVAVDRGARVSRGDLLLTLRSGAELAAFKLAKARLAFARRKLARNEDLVRQSLISAHEIDEMETEARIAALELEAARARLAMRKVRSPLDGIVVNRQAEPGEYVGADAVLTLVALDPLSIELVAPVSALGSIRAGMVVSVEPHVVGGARDATVTLVDPVVDPAS
ncbi:MAG: efflux RND transporter periplasmic adaptor subunit, partial [Gammaproteobacteria bacterium]